MICSICRHEQRSEIDGELLASGPLRPMADRYGVSKTSLIRHRTNCISAQLAKAKEISEVATASSLVKELRELTKKTGEVLARAVRQKNGDLALKALARLERQLELKGRLLGQLEERNNGGATVVHVVYVDKLTAGTQSSPHNFRDTKPNGLKTLIEGTCEPLLADQNLGSAGGPSGTETDGFVPVRQDASVKRGGL